VEQYIALTSAKVNKPDSVVAAGPIKRAAGRKTDDDDEPYHINPNRNLMNYPLARDSMTKAVWRRSASTGRWLCELPGDERIQFRLAGTKLKRCPSGLDMKVLFWMLREAQRLGHHTIKLPSAASFLAALELGVDTNNRRRLSAALELWSALTIVYRSWHFIGRPAGKKVLPPAIQSTSANGRQITISPDWLEMEKGYFEQVPWPLPNAAAVQNLVLRLMTCNDEQVKFSNRKLCAIIGLNHSTQRRSLRKVIKQAQKWFKRHGGQLEEYSQHDHTPFLIIKPKVPRSKAKQAKQDQADQAYIAADQQMSEERGRKLRQEDNENRRRKERQQRRWKKMAWEEQDGDCLDDVAMLYNERE
jgi:hypothetical protein